RLEPVERGANPLALKEIPSVGEPQLRPLVAPVLHEREILRVRRQPIGESERLEVDAMARTFVVVRETIARESDLDDAAGEIDESDRIRLDWSLFLRPPIRGSKRVHSERVLDVRQDP